MLVPTGSAWQLEVYRVCRATPSTTPSLPSGSHILQSLVGSDEEIKCLTEFMCGCTGKRCWV